MIRLHQTGTADYLALSRETVMKLANSLPTFEALCYRRYRYGIIKRAETLAARLTTRHTLERDLQGLRARRLRKQSRIPRRHCYRPRYRRMSPMI
jgi:hypothetical protein